MVLGTTTWRGRNSDKIAKVGSIARDRGFVNPEIINYGPGGAVNFLFSLLPEGNKSDWSGFNRIQRSVVKLIESPIRKTGLFYLETSEPQEILDALRDLNPKKMFVVDREKRVLDSVKRTNWTNQIIEYCQMDVRYDRLGRQGDIVIAYNVVERTEDWDRSLDNIARSVSAGGLFSTTLEGDLRGFERLENGTYIKKR